MFVLTSAKWFDTHLTKKGWIFDPYVVSPNQNESCRTKSVLAVIHFWNPKVWLCFFLYTCAWNWMRNLGDPNRWNIGERPTFISDLCLWPLFPAFLLPLPNRRIRNPKILRYCYFAVCWCRQCWIWIPLLEHVKVRKIVAQVRFWCLTVTHTYISYILHLFTLGTQSSGTDHLGTWMLTLASRHHRNQTL